MHNQSPFVKLVIWLMIFLMSVGFAALVISPFLGGGSLFGGGDNGRDATRKIVTEARADAQKDHCTDTKPRPTGKRLHRCEDALGRLASSYMTLATPAQGETEAPRDSKRNLDRAEHAWRALYELDPTNEENTARYAGFLRDSGKPDQALKLWQRLVKQHPKNEEYLLQLAGAYQQTNALDQAIATFRLFIKRFPDSGDVQTAKDQIKAIQDQQKQQAAGGGAGTPGAQSLNIG
jgi:hypothetical protein